MKMQMMMGRTRKHREKNDKNWKQEQKSVAHDAWYWPKKTTQWGLDGILTWVFDEIFRFATDWCSNWYSMRRVIEGGQWWSINDHPITKSPRGQQNL